MRKVWMRLFYPIALVGVLGAAWRAQYAHEVKLTNNPSYPLQIASVFSQLNEDATEFRGATFTLQNTGNVPCVAFGVSFVVAFSNSEKRSVYFDEDHASLGYANPDSAIDPIMPKQVYAKIMQVRASARESATITGIGARLDYVEMADGKKYGNDPHGLGAKFRASRWAHLVERKRLLGIYDASGLPAMLDEMRRE